ncbi:hypothetical protein ACI65C_010242 [Semiaphis heraclei]
MVNVDYENIKKYPTVECALCGFLFRNKPSLKHHLDSMHNGSKTLSGFIKKRPRKCTDLQCMEKGCKCKFYNKQLFISHLKFDHCIDFDIRCLKFTSEGEFLTWKEDFEQESNSRYVRVTGCKTLQDGKKLSYYYCNRSTYFTSKSKGVRKRSTPVKVKGLCTASIKEVHNSDGSVEILLCATHYGHDISTEHMRMTKREREEITQLIQQGDHPDFVINAARAKASDSLGRVHMLNRKDIKNIERKLGIRHPEFIKQRTINDLSTDRWIMKLQRTPYNPILFYKPINVKYENLERNDIMLIFMTQNQYNWINKFGTDGIFMVTEMSMVCAQLYLTVLYVCDEFNVMLPVCFMMCNDSKIYQSFFLNIIFNKMGYIYAKALITDDNYDLYESWCSIMSPVKHVINQRYIDNQIIEKLQTDIEKQDLQHEIYDKICSFFNGSNESMKEEIINYTNNNLKMNNETKPFGIFFDQMFASRADMWAFCYLKESLNLNQMININTVYNQMIVLCENNKKHFTSNLSKNMHIFFTALLEIQKNRKKKIEEINIKISKNHRNAMCYPSRLIFPLSNNKWRVTLEDGTNNGYVTITRKFCKIVDCSVKCQACYNICAHIYECSCGQGEITICEHVHMLGIFNKRSLIDMDELKEEKLDIDDMKTNILLKLKRIIGNLDFVNDEELLRRISVSLSRVENTVNKVKKADDWYDD